MGPLIGGAIMEGWNWQAIFWINIPVAIVAIPLALIVLRNDFGARVRASTFRARSSPRPACSALVHAIVRGNDDGWGSAGVIAELAGRWRC